jgi:hypothetical protein
MTKFETFKLICQKCGSDDTQISITMYDSCDIRDVTCLKCENEESW